MKLHLKLEQFEGPFDLLLNLIGEEKLDISELSLSKVTEQYLAYLDQLERNKAEEIADFLVVAARLLLLKSKLLLPQFLPEPEEGASLEEQLRLYQAFIGASKKINSLWSDKKKAFFRNQPLKSAKRFIPPDDFTMDQLHQSMVQLINRLEPAKPLPETQIDKTISIKEKIDQIRKLLNRKKKIEFSEVLTDVKNRTELIIVFLALLELVKQQAVVLKQNRIFDIIVIKKI